MKKLFLLPILFFVLGCSEEDDEYDDLNSQISALSSQVAGLTSDLAGLTSDLDDLTGTVNSNTALNVAQEQELQTAQELINQLNQERYLGDDSNNIVAADDEAPDALSDQDFNSSDKLDSILAAATDSFLKIHDNSAWKMTEEAFTEYTLFYNSEESPFKVHDLNGCNDSFDGNNILTDESTYIMVDLNSNTVTFQYFADEDYIERVEGIYRDTLSRVESTADALWSELGCD